MSSAFIVDGRAHFYGYLIATVCWRSAAVNRNIMSEPVVLLQRLVFLMLLSLCITMFGTTVVFLYLSATL